jgi:alpha-amylase
MPIVARAGLPRRAAAVAVAAVVLFVAACGSAPPSVSPASASTAASESAAAASSGGCSTAQPIPATAHWWNDRVFYEVFVRSFHDSNGDGIGDLRGLIEKLDYLNDGNASTTDDLGITGLWLMPVTEAASYHGYDVTDYRAIEHDYGTSSDFKRLVAEAHRRGIAVIVDLVLNHTSSRHPWFRDAITPGSPHDDWYVWSPTDPGYPGPSGQAVWHKAGDRYYYGVFSESMPDLNLRNPKVTAELTDVARYWLDDLGVDGFRLDAAMHLIEEGRKQINTPSTLAWLRDFHAAVRGDKTAALLVGEVFAGASIAGRYVPDSVDLTFDFDLAGATVAALQSRQPAPLVSALDETIRWWPADQEATFLTNHDQDRVMSQLNGDVAASRLAAFMLLTQPGVPFVYYGEEIGMRGSKPDERIRTPMQWSANPPAGGFSSAKPWEALQDDWATINVAAETGARDSLLSTYRSLIRLRGAQPALRDGATLTLQGTGVVTGWLQTDADSTLLAVVNLGDQPVSDYGLTVAGGPLCGSGRVARVVASVNAPGATTSVAAPTANARGGFADYRPLPELPPRSGFLLSLDPAP